jgi:hypothetical protein
VLCTAFWQHPAILVVQFALLDAETRDFDFDAVEVCTWDDVGLGVGEGMGMEMEMEMLPGKTLTRRS